MSAYKNYKQRPQKSAFTSQNSIKSDTAKHTATPRRSSSKNAVKAFNPAEFIKIVDEQVIGAVYQAKHSFADFPIDMQIKENIIQKGYITPTAIQDQVIPLILDGKDVIATANTGTGKTAAFLIPLIHNVLVKKTKRVLVITPTRELAAQIKQELDSFKAQTHCTSILCIGGINISPQIQLLRQDPVFVIGTPGRLKDLEQNHAINFHRYDAIVLDEVDTMLDMGFIQDIRSIISKLPSKRHSLFFSATIPEPLKKLMATFLRNPASVAVQTRQTAQNVDQSIMKIGQQNKIEMLHDLLIKPDFKKVIIFSRTKRSADKLSKMLKERGFDIAAIHGDKTQAQRSKALASFKAEHIKILLATDVVARGIDIDDISHVINFDMPQTQADYIHRIGRTGRADKKGHAITFVD